MATPGGIRVKHCQKSMYRNVFGAQSVKCSSVESLQSHYHTKSHWSSSGLTLCFLSQGTWVQNPWGDLCATGILLLALSRYIGDPDVIDHHCGLV